MRAPLRALVAAVAVLATLCTAAPRADAYPSSHVEFEGHGWGHGRGLGQYGSLGYAVDEDRPYSWIVDHYYGGTTKGAKADGLISVRLTAFDGTTAAPRDMILTSTAGYALRSTGPDDAFAANQAARVAWNGSGFTIFRGTSCAGPWTEVRRIPSTAAVEARTAYAGDDINQMLNACEPGGNRRAYRGTLMFRLITENGTGFLRLINNVLMEQYLRGVVPRESPASWGDADSGRGLNALKAQAVAARSYAWAETRSTHYKTCDTTACQVYGGAGLNGARIEHVNTDRAISDTREEVRILNGNGAVARTEFSSSTGGYTAGGTFPAVPDTGDDISSNPNHQWNTDVFVTKVQEAYPTVGTLQAISVTDRNGLGQSGGRAEQVKLVGDRATVTVTANDLRSKLGLKSDWYRIVDATLSSPASAISTLRSGNGVILASTAGETQAYGEAGVYGSMEGTPLAKPVVGMALTASGKGYWLAAADGGVFNFGDAPDLGSLGGRRLNKPIVGIAATPSGRGFYLVASDGGIFSFGDAVYAGSTGAMRLNQPIVGMAVHPTGIGYYLVARDGGIFTFGTAKFRGSTGAIRLNQPIVGMTVHPRGLAYWFVAADGGVFTFPGGNRYFYGSLGGTTLASPIAGMATTPTGNGYWLVGQDAALYDFGDAGF
jgi:SpoIID/LytB domain protein